MRYILLSIFLYIQCSEETKIPKEQNPLTTSSKPTKYKLKLVFDKEPKIDSRGFERIEATNCTLVKIPIDSLSPYNQYHENNSLRSHYLPIPEEKGYNYNGYHNSCPYPTSSKVTDLTTTQPLHNYNPAILSDQPNSIIKNPSLKEPFIVRIPSQQVPQSCWAIIQSIFSKFSRSNSN